MKKAIIIVAIVGVIGTAAYFYYKNQVSKLIDMDWEVVGVSFDKAQINDTIMNLKVQLTSKSTIEAEVQDMKLDVYINDKHVGVITNNEKLIIPAKGFSVIDVKVSTKPLEIYSDALSLIGQLWKDKDAMLTLRGKVKIKTAFIVTNLPVDYTESIKYLMS